MKSGLSDFQAEVSGFSGPFDLLCYLVENGRLEAAGISVGQAVRIYGAYLANTRHVSMAVVSDFLAMAASLVLSKIKSLIPGSRPTSDEEETFGDGEPSGEDVEERLSRYRPYRTASAFLRDKKEEQDLMFSRTNAKEGPATWDLGDLYGLCTIWWDLLEELKGSSPPVDPDSGRSEEWDGAPAPVPDEAQIDMKMLEIMKVLGESSGAAFSSLVERGSPVGVFVVTLLALLELSRRGAVRIVQKELFGDVFIYDARGDF